MGGAPREGQEVVAYSIRTGIPAKSYQATNSGAMASCGLAMW